MRRLAGLALLLSGPAFAQAPPVADVWVARPGFELGVLDKVTARVTPLSGRVGQSVTTGTLTVSVRSCIVRGPDQPADQAAYLDITDSRDPAVAFHAWMLLSNPGLSMLEHPIYDIRLTACRA